MDKELHSEADGDPPSESSELGHESFLGACTQQRVDELFARLKATAAGAARHALHLGERGGSRSDGEDRGVG